MITLPPKEDIQLLRTYAYNILGSYVEAEDVVQDVLEKQLQHPPQEQVENPRAYLTRAVINHAINIKKRNQRIRSDYPGSWLPEPVTETFADSNLLRKETLQYSLLVLMEKLTAKERAVFMLKEAFNYSHEEIAETLHISADNSRQLLRRAKLKVQEDHTLPESANLPEKAQAYFAAIIAGDVHQLEHILAEEITVTADGGGKATANRDPVSGREKVIKTLLGYYNKHQKQTCVEPAMVNHQPAFLYYSGTELVNCQVMVFTEKGLSRVYFIRNPDKLKSIQKNL